MRSLGKFLFKSRNLVQPTNGLGVSDFVSVGHMFAFLSSHYTFSTRSRILRCHGQSRRLGESRIYHSPPAFISVFLILAFITGKGNAVELFAVL